MYDLLRIFQFLSDRGRSGEATCLVTVTGVTGASVRNPGAHMAVAQDGAYRGSLSGGCIEQAVVAEALEAIREQRPRMVTYGSGSDIVDIRLPCGGSVHLLFTPLSGSTLADQVNDTLAQRGPCVISLSSTSDQPRLSAEGATGWAGDMFAVRHYPPLRLVIAGHGASVTALARLALAMDIATYVGSPDAQLVREMAKDPALEAHHLEKLTAPVPVALDPWTAVVFLFHDHDWEAALMKAAAQSSAFFIGAMGSRKTHQARREVLAQMGLADELIERIEGPIGLIPSSRDPETLALSTLAQVVDHYNALIGAQYNA